MPLLRPTPALALATSLLPAAAATAGDDEAVAIAALPPAVRAVADAAAPNTTWTDARREVDHGRATFEIEGQAAGGQRVEVDVEADAAGTNARVAKLELLPGIAAPLAVASSPPPRAAGGEDGQSAVWPVVLGALAVVGFLLKAIFADAFDAIGVVIARKLGAERVGQAIERRFARDRADAADPPPPSRVEPEQS